MQSRNILIENGIITYIGTEEKEAALTIDVEGLSISAGWVDMFALTGEPGLEYKEDLQSMAEAAAAGGFTEVLCMPNVTPVVQTKGAVSYLKNRSAPLPVTLHATAAVTIDTQGKELTEMIDLQQTGAIAFSDGDKPLQGADVMLKALQYLQLFDGLLINKPENTRLTEHGQMHEGYTSTLLGMKGIPSLAEEIVVTRDLQLLAYAGGRLHFSHVSASASIEAIRKAKASGQHVTCDTASYQIAYTDETIVPFDTNYKVAPPFRSKKDAEAIKEGLADGTIDVLVSGHHPQDTEAKKLEFDLAEFGIINLETAFAVANTSFSAKLSTAELINKFSTNPRKILRLPQPNIKEGEQANVTIFSPLQKWVPTQAAAKSKSNNSPFFGQELTGRVIGIIHKGQVVLN